MQKQSVSMANMRGQHPCTPSQEQGKEGWDDREWEGKPSSTHLPPCVLLPNMKGQLTNGDKALGSRGHALQDPPGYAVPAAPSLALGHGFLCSGEMPAALCGKEVSSREAMKTGWGL